MKTSNQIREEIKSQQAVVKAIVDLATSENREINAEEQETVTAAQESIPKLQASLENTLKIETLVAQNFNTENIDKRQQPKAEDKRLTVPIRVKSSFRKGVFQTAEEAYNCGQWVRAALFNVPKAKAYCRDAGLKIRNAMSTGDNTKGGFLVPEPLVASIIELREQYGVFARYSMPWNMTNAVENVPKMNGEVTSYYVGEGQEITASDMAFGLVRLEAKKLAALTAISSELNEDSVISVAEVIARSVASKFAYDEDNAGFNGDGTSTYGGIEGAAGALAAGAIVTATAVTTVAGLTMTPYENAVGKLKEYPGIRPAWFVHKNTWANSMQRLLNALGGNSNSDVAGGAPMTFLGYPVVTTQVLYNGAGATGAIFGYFGDLSMTSYIGRRRGMTMAADSSVYFTKDQIAIRATQRYDINVYDRGTASEAGGLVALKFG